MQLHDEMTRASTQPSVSGEEACNRSNPLGILNDVANANTFIGTRKATLLSV